MLYVKKVPYLIQVCSTLELLPGHDSCVRVLRGELVQLTQQLLLLGRQLAQGPLQLLRHLARELALAAVLLLLL